MATPEQLAAIRDELRNEIRAEFRMETAAAAASIPDAIKRKPEIPQFDKDNIDVWIRRTENAFTRASISSPRDKFAFLETKFTCNFNPRINEYLWGAATQDQYDHFLNYLRAEYGPTKQQKASVIIDGFKRDGRKPSQYAAALDEKTKGITLEDIKKEMLVREMPIETRRMLQERIEGLSFQKAAEIADAYFDKEGRPRFQNSQINNIQCPELELDSLDQDGINALTSRPLRRPNPGSGSSRPPQKGWHAPTAARPQKSTPQKGWHAQTASKTPATPQNSEICWYHEKHGDKARSCESWCKLYDAKRFPGNGRARHT